jgi:hypothetical protein
MHISSRFKQILVISVLSCCASAASDQYFPEGIFSENAADDKAWSDRFSRQLVALDEPPLRVAAGSPFQSYRFLWQRSFHPALAVRLDVQQDGTGIVVTKMSRTVKGSKRAGVETTRRVLAKQETDGFLRQIHDSGFWKMSTRLNPIDVGPDGAQWLLEGFKGHNYHAVLRWSPKDGSVRTLGLKLAIDLGGLRIPGDQIY